MSSKKQPPSSLNDAFARPASKDLRSLMGWFVSLFDSAAAGPVTPESNPKEQSKRAHYTFSIHFDIFLDMVTEALNAKRIEHYQAALLLASNMSEPLRYNGTDKSWESFLPSLIALHNNGPMTFNEKRRILMAQIAPDKQKDFDMLDRAGITINTNPGRPGIHRDTRDDVYFNRKGNDEVSHNRAPRPEDINSEGTFERNDDGTSEKTYSAIPKNVLKPLIQEAMLNKRMVPAQAALMIAVNCHAMKLRKFSKVRYLDHVMGVAEDERLTPSQRIVAVLHDVLEDSNWTASDLREIGMPSSIVKSLEHMTKRPEETVYLHFIERVAYDRDAVAVKIADIRHNMKDAKDKAPKYRLALAYLQGIQMGSVRPGDSIEAYARSIGDYKAEMFLPEVKKTKGSNDNNSGSSISAVGPAPRAA